ncbi:MAG TPA: hypothetical protein P5281_03320, partial [Anaerovoracaceae bacterium]|nr:hypothetical protein [Anaerovoracaceae bacterium]
MTRLPALLCGMNAYRKAGPYGRRYLRSMHRQSARNEGGSESDYMSDLCQWKMLMRNFLMCDRCFSAWVPKEITSATGSDRFSIYKRLIPFAWVCQAIRVRLFAAFGLECDRAAEERSVLQSFTHREWNDLIDQGGVSSEELYDIINPDKRFPAELKLYQSFSQRLVQTVSTEKFPNYYRLVHESPHTVLKHSTREAAARVTAENSHFSVRLSLYVMCNDLPDT